MPASRTYLPLSPNTMIAQREVQPVAVSNRRWCPSQPML